jgi:asparagine synthase (glutamine-hydrolysing)
VGIAQQAGTRIDADVLVRMRDSMLHRGPDGAGLELDDGIGLGHRRLAILDLSEAGRQPMRNEDDSLWLVANGEIFNYVELGEELRAKGHRLRSSCDSEVILHLYEDHGVECLRFLNGMFAFALWDRRRRRLFAARDRMGVKPFYFHQRPHGIAFASEIKALLEDPSVLRSPDPRGVADFLFCGQPLGGKTLFEGISELRPGHALVFEAGRTRIWPYWRPDYRNKIERPDAVVLDEVRALLYDAVRLRVRSDVALGTQLSGGVDSGVVTALTNYFRPGSKSFTLRSGQGGYYDETPQARRVARHLGTLHHESMVESADLDRDLTKLVWHMDMPMPNPGGFNYHAVAKLEAEHVKVVMTGHGGDELFAGYPAQFQACFGHQSMFDRSTVPPKRREPSVVYRMRRVLRQLGWRGVMKDQLRRRLTPQREGLEEEWVRLHCSPLEGDPDLHPAFLESLAGYSPVDEYLDQLRNAGAEHALDRCLNHDLRCYLPGLLFMEDRASMAVSIESRTPLLDYRIAEYLVRLPVEQRVRGLVPKWLLREIGRPLLTDEIVDRRVKIPFPLPMDEWLANDFGEAVQRILASNAARGREIFLPDALCERGFRAGHAWPALSLELWFRTFIDGKLQPGTPLSEVGAY